MYPRADTGVEEDLMRCFQHKQNGSIMEGLTLWKNNVDKRFEGVEDCMICFSVIHGSNYSLPKKACRTCKKRFHSACLVSCSSVFRQRRFSDDVANQAYANEGCLLTLFHCLFVSPQYKWFTSSNKSTCPLCRETFF